MINLLLIITASITFMVIGAYYLDKYGIQQSLDETLRQSESTLQTLLVQNPEPALINQLQNSLQTAAKAKLISTNNDNRYFEVWDRSGKSILYSPQFGFPLNDFTTDELGFSDQHIQGATWRVYTAIIANGNYKILIAESYATRNLLSNHLIHDNTYIMALSYSIAVLLVWIVIWRGLSSIRRVADEVSHRALNYLQPVNIARVPTEIKPLVNELNKLFLRLQEAFAREQRFAADAAHELRTPLAAIKTQAQVAIKLADSPDLQNVLNNVLTGVDRATHVVQQLLALSRLPEQEALEGITRFDLNELTLELIDLLSPLAIEKNLEIRIDTTPEPLMIDGNRMALSILIRNLIDNAIRYTTPGGYVEVVTSYVNQRPILRISDNGPGIPAELRSRVFERFYRVLGNKSSGSGLGLSIVQQIAKLHHAEVILGTPKSGNGLEVEVFFTTPTEVEN